MRFSLNDILLEDFQSNHNWGKVAQIMLARTFRWQRGLGIDYDLQWYSSYDSQWYSSYNSQLYSSYDSQWYSAMIHNDILLMIHNDILLMIHNDILLANQNPTLVPLVLSPKCMLYWHQLRGISKNSVYI